MLFSETDFKKSFQTNDGTYCSSCLVNSICAMACHLLDKEDTDGGSEISTLTQAFMNEAKRGIPPQQSMPLTCVQALAVMYLVELSSNKARSAIGYLRACMECLQTANLDGQSFEARELSLWGMQTLNTYEVVISLFFNQANSSDDNRSSTGITYQKLYAPSFPQMDQPSDIQMDRDDMLWRFYRRIGDERDLPFRPGHMIMTASCQAGLFRIIHESIDLYCGLRGIVTAEAVLKVYRRYIDWETDLNPILSNVDISIQPLPHVLFLQ